MEKKIIICADDFGMNSAINEGIITLLENRKISAVSCMSNQSAFKQDGKRLLPFLRQAKIGLHFNLAYSSLGLFILKSYLGCLNQQSIEKALSAQYEQFIKIMGQKPDFIDGHQHIHQLPLIRKIVLKFYKAHYPNYDGFIRNTYHSRASSLKAKMINALGGKKLKGLLEREKIPYNKNFSGVYNLSEKKNYALLLTQFIHELEGDGLMMCHPAKAQTNSNELFRVNEFNTLMQYEA
jgi:predicted glycoside hydrolase/deacetylase ChbG (UPF0249 family)